MVAAWSRDSRIVSMPSVARWAASRCRCHTCIDLQQVAGAQLAVQQTPRQSKRGASGTRRWQCCWPTCTLYCTTLRCCAWGATHHRSSMAGLIAGSLNSIAYNYFFRDLLLLPELDDDVTFLVALPSSTVRTRAAKSMEQNDSLELYSVGAKLTNISVLLCLAVQ